MNYRPDVQGLRAIAVLPVLAFHVGFSAVPGGFVGVDVFFVISGYLITQLLQRDIGSGQFSLAGFYERRIRRIAPALVAMLLITFALGAYYDLPDELVTLSKSLLAAAASASNLYFWTQSGYFDADSTGSPLLHTWSLAVEEQFYLLWPLYLFWVQRYWKRWLIPLTIAITAVSLAVAAWGAFRQPAATFYMPYTRLWELSAGGLIALGALPTIRGPATREALSALGIVLIVASVFLIRSSMPFPGLMAMPPCLGALLVILAGRDDLPRMSKLLAIAPLTAVGALSYSLYLWHWPLTVFQRSDALLAAGLSPAKTKLLVVGASFAAAALSYWLIETPFRDRRMGAARAGLMRLAAASFVIVLTLGSIAWTLNGIPERFERRELDMVAHLKILEEDAWRPNRCFLYDEHGYQLASECTRVDPQHRNILLLGDSHAAQLYRAFSRTFEEAHFLQVSASNCYPTLTHAFNESQECAAVMNRTLHGLEGKRQIDGVILLAKWRESMLPALEETLEWLKVRGIPVTVMGPTAVYDAQVPRLVLSSMRHADPTLLSRHMDNSVFGLDDRMRLLSQQHGAAYISLLEFECMAAPCRRDGEIEWPEVFDQEHLNSIGAMQVAVQIKARYPQFGH